MNTAPAFPTTRTGFVNDDFFGHQHTATSALPDPQPMVENLARSVMEILAGCRDLEQISRWVTDDVYRNLLQRVHISRRARAVKKQPVVLPTFGLGRTIITHPASTTHSKLPAEEKAALGITDGLVRVAVGLESIEDLKADFLQALNQIS